MENVLNTKGGSACSIPGIITGWAESDGRNWKDEQLSEGKDAGI